MTAMLDAVRAEISDLAGRAAVGPEFGEAVAASVGSLLPNDGWCLLGLAPRTGLRTFQFGRGGTEHTSEMAENEALQNDVNKYADLGRAAMPVGWLARDHPGASSSVRFNEILRPQGYASELRLVLREHGWVWGALCLFRESPHRSFGDTEALLAARVSMSLTRALRRYPMRPVARRPAPLAPGIVLLSPSNICVAISEEARAWLADLVPGGLDDTRFDDVMRVVYDAANAVRRDGCSAPGSAHPIVRTVSGRWMFVNGTSLQHGAADVAVLLQPATVAQLLRYVADVHRLSARELEVLERVTAGLATKQIARDLGLSPFTVNDHLKAIYRKCGTAGREELVGQLI